LLKLEVIKSVSCSPEDVGVENFVMESTEHEEEVFQGASETKPKDRAFSA
jgi:hypothetical protein